MTYKILKEGPRNKPEKGFKLHAQGPDGAVHKFVARHGARGCRGCAFEGGTFGALCAASTTACGFHHIVWVPKKERV